MSMVRCVSRASVFALLLASAAPAAAIHIASGETLVVKFGFPSAPEWTAAPPGIPPDFPNFTTDLLYGHLAAGQVSGMGAPRALMALYDGGTLLGSYELDFSYPWTTFAFSSPTGLFTFRGGRVADFSSIADGTIDGELRITNISTQPYANFSAPIIDFQVTSLYAAHGMSSSSLVDHNPYPVIESQQKLVPQEVPAPAALALFGLGILGLGAVRRAR